MVKFDFLGWSRYDGSISVSVTLAWPIDRGDAALPGNKLTSPLFVVRAGCGLTSDEGQQGGETLG